MYVDGTSASAPIVAGAIATVMVLTAQSTRWWQLVPILASIALTCAIAWVLLRAANIVDRIAAG